MSNAKLGSPTMRERLEALSLSNLLYYAITGTQPTTGNVNWKLESQS